MPMSQIVALRNAAGLSLTQIAAATNCTMVMERLIQYAKTRNDNLSILSEQFLGCSPAFHAILAACHDTAILLLAAGAPVEGLDSNENNALHCAAFAGNDALVRRLLHHERAGEWLTLKNRQQLTPVQIAARCLRGDIIAILLQHEEPQRVENANTTGWKALHWAAWYMRLDLVKLLIANGVDVGQKDSSDRTAEELVRTDNPDSIAFSEWLSLPDSYNKLEVSPRVRKPDMAGSEVVCKGASAYLMDFYGVKTVEKS